MRPGAIRGRVPVPGVDNPRPGDDGQPGGSRHDPGPDLEAADPRHDAFLAQLVGSKAPKFGDPPGECKEEQGTQSHAVDDRPPFPVREVHGSPLVDPLGCTLAWLTLRSYSGPHEAGKLPGISVPDVGTCDRGPSPLP